jgi:hypothetical protein
MALVGAVFGNSIGDVFGELVECNDAISGDYRRPGTEGTQLLECEGVQRNAGLIRDGSGCADTKCLIQTHGLKGNTTGSCKATLTI